MTAMDFGRIEAYVIDINETWRVMYRITDEDGNATHYGGAVKEYATAEEAEAARDADRDVLRGWLRESAVQIETMPIPDTPEGLL